MSQSADQTGSLESADAPAPDVHPWRARLAGLALAVVVGAAYLYTLYPGVSKGDSAEMQYMCPLLGICHPPGYALEVVVGKGFSLLPIGPNVAWRINFMQAVCGVIGCLALLGTVRRLTGQMLPGLLASATLAFSIIYWQASVRAEVYAFYGMFLLLGVYAAVRFLQSDASGWLILAALGLGVCIGGRLSEILILPAIAGLWLGSRPRRRLGARRLIGAVGVAVLPFLFSVGFDIVRENPALLHARDDAVRDELMSDDSKPAQPTWSQKLRQAVAYSLGLTGAGRQDFTRFAWPRLKWDLDKYAWHLSGLGAFGERYPADLKWEGVVTYPAREQGPGTGIGLLGILLAGAGIWRWRRAPGVVLLGVGLFLGNLVYYVYMHPVDNLQFTIPGQAGLAVLLALGVARRPPAVGARPTPRRRGWFRGYQVAGFAVPAFLLATNLGIANPRTDEVRESLRLAELTTKTPLPPNPVVLATYSRTHTLRYLYWVEAQRPDVRVVIFGEWLDVEAARRLLLGLEARGYSIMVGTDAISKDDTRHVWARWTPRELIDIGLFRPPPLHRGVPGRLPESRR